jgi:hypothetical protein
MTAVTSERPTRSAAEAALRAMGKNGRADYDHDRRYRPLMLLATLSWFGLVERVTRIELALSAWEAQRLPLPGALTRRPWRSRMTLAAPSSLWLMTR